MPNHEKNLISARGDKLVSDKGVSNNCPMGFAETFEEKVERTEENPKLIIALQYCPLDEQQAFDLAYLLASLEEARREDVTFAFSYRQDSKPPSPKLLAAMGDAFGRVVVWKGIRGSKGHPAGCNALWIDTMTQAAEEGVRGGVSGIFTMESDDVPIRRDWVTGVQQAWAVALERGKMVTGCLMEKSKECPEHINGNAIFHTQSLRKWVGLPQCPPHFAWDVWGTRYFRQSWVPSNFIANLYRRKNLTKKEAEKIQQSGTVVIHGVKDDSALKLIERLA